MEEIGTTNPKYQPLQVLCRPTLEKLSLYARGVMYMHIYVCHSYMCCVSACAYVCVRACVCVVYLHVHAYMHACVCVVYLHVHVVMYGLCACLFIRMLGYYGNILLYLNYSYNTVV